MRILAIFILFFGLFKISWAQYSDDICICELENTTAFNYFDSNEPTVVAYPTETIYSVFSFSSNSEESSEVELPTEESVPAIYGMIPEKEVVGGSGNGGAVVGEELELAEEEEMQDVVEREPVGRDAVGAGGGAPRQQSARAGGSRNKQKRYRNKRIGGGQQVGRVRLKRKKGIKKYKGKCPSF